MSATLVPNQARAQSFPVLLSLKPITPLVSHEAGLNLTPTEKCDTYGHMMLWRLMSPAVMGLWSPVSGKPYFITRDRKRGLQCSCQGHRRRQGQHLCWHLLTFLRDWNGTLVLAPAGEAQA